MKKAIASFSRHFTWAECVLAFLVAVLFLIDSLVQHHDLSAVNLNGWIGMVAFKVLPYTSFAMIPILFMGRVIKVVYFLLTCLFVLLESILVFVWYNFRMQMGGAWVGIIRGCSKDEIVFFLRNYMGWKAALSTVVVFCAIYVAFRAIKKLKPVGFVGIRIIVAMVLITVAFLLKRPGSLSDQVAAIFLITDSYKVANSQREFLLTWPKNQPVPILRPEVDDSCLGIVVLGESATRNHWHLYGYNRDTTPCMDALSSELNVFSDLVTPAPNTDRALELLLTAATVDAPYDFKFTLPMALNRAGFSVSMYTNQSRWGKWGMDNYLFSGCSTMMFMDEQNFKRPWYDNILINYLEMEITERAMPKIVFLHLRGSHIPASAQYPYDCAIFGTEGKPGEMTGLSKQGKIDHYDNSIHFTDNILGDIITKLKKRGGATWMIYLSDHGETPESDGWRVADHRDLWEIPMIVWVSREYREKFPDIVRKLEKARAKPLQSDQLFCGILSIAGVSGCGTGTSCDFLEDSFEPRVVRKILEGKMEYKWEVVNYER